VVLDGTDRDDPAGARQLEEPPFEVGWATSVGSLPHTDTNAAVQFVLATQADLPAAPTLPQRSPLEGMIAQAAWGIAGVSLDERGELVIDRDAVDPDAPLADLQLEGEPFHTLRAFLDAVSLRTGPIKVQLTGPVTLGLALSLAGLDEDVAFRVAKQAVAARARSIISLATDTAPAAPLVVFVDEPALVGTAQLGFPLATDDVVDLVSGALAVIEPFAVTGVHCCGTADWRAVLMAGPQVLSMPVGAGASEAAGALSAFVEAGGWMAWGAVPTSAPLGDQAGIYWKALSAQWCDLVRNGCDPVLIRHRSLITPECGLALHEVGQAEHVLQLCKRVAECLQDQAVGIRLSAGA
jgi:hypothetical protein